MTRRAAGWLGGLVAGCALLALAFINAARFLEAPARPPDVSDLIVVLGGDAGERVLTAASDYVRGIAPYVLLTGRETHPTEHRPQYANWRAPTLIEHGVPGDRILVDRVSATSWDEAVNTLRLMHDKGWRRVVVVSDPYHMRRLDWIWSRVFRGSGCAYTLVASAPDYWKPGRWWMSERAGAAVIMEYVKLLYYVARYP